MDTQVLFFLTIIIEYWENNFWLFKSNWKLLKMPLARQYYLACFCVPPIDDIFATEFALQLKSQLINILTKWIQLVVLV